MGCAFETQRTLRLRTEVVHRCHSHRRRNLIEAFAFFMYGYQEAVLWIRRGGYLIEAVGHS